MTKWGKQDGNTEDEAAGYCLLVLLGFGHAAVSEPGEIIRDWWDGTWEAVEDMINIVSQPLEIILLCCPFSWRILFCTSLRELGLFIVFSYRSTEQSLNLKWISFLFSIVLSLSWCCLKWQMKVQHLKPCSLFYIFYIKMHSIKSRFVIGQQNTLFTGLCAQSLAQEFYKLELWRGLPVENYSWKQVTSKVKFDCDYLRERGLN